MIAEGKYNATLVSYEIGETKAGEPQAVLVFEIQDSSPMGQQGQKITYWGSFSERAAQYTVKNLITCGLKGNNPAGELEIGREVELVVIHEVGNDGKTRAKIRYINRIGGMKRPAIPQDMAKAKLKALEGLVLKTRVETGSDDEEGFGF